VTRSKVFAAVIAIAETTLVVAITAAPGRALTTMPSSSPPPPPPPLEGAPQTLLTKHPKARVRTTKARVTVVFAFTASTSAARFKCKLDRSAFTACASPKRYSVKPGKHTFSVAAVNAGTADATPAVFRFTVVRARAA
jgi:hypothetical protein